MCDRMQLIHQKIQIGYQYGVYFTRDALSVDNTALAEAVDHNSSQSPRPALFVIDDGVASHHPHLLDSIHHYCQAHRNTLTLAGEPLLLPGGEQAKNHPQHLMAVYDAIVKTGLCRQSYVVVIGGGAVIDLAGYAAATAHRGIRLIRMPTTVLAQNDSAVGVKNSINAYGRKNFLGTFAPPAAVINDSNFLTTLSDRDWLAGAAEAVKVALIKDKAFFDFLCEHTGAIVDRNMPAMQHLVHRCAALHLDHIANGGDPFELGTSRPLDFGHWAAHKLEQMTDFELRHGEAVSIGIALDVAYSHLIDILPEQAMRNVHACLASLKLPLFHDAMRDHATLLEGLDEFREHLGGELTIMLLSDIGAGLEVHEINRQRMIDAIGLLADLSAPAAAERVG